jgi:(E)-2-((N-methylformamido)methylene)succinate hydrolase
VRAPSVQVEDGLLYCERTGTGPPVVLIHGVAGSHRIWDPLVPLLDQDYSIVRVDLMGYGNSPQWIPECTPIAHCEAIRRTLSHIGTRPPYSVVGLSMGTNLALAYACQWPDEVQRVIGLAFPYFGSAEDARAGLAANLWTRLALNRPRLAKKVLPATWSVIRHSGITRFHRGIYTPAMAYDAFRVNYAAFESSMRTCMLEFSCADALECTSDIPRLFVHGDHDSWVTSERVGQAIASFHKSKLEVLCDAPHNIVVTEPAQTATIIRRFLTA